MELIDRLLSLDGLGTELGIANALTLVVFISMAVVLGWLARREIKRIKAKVDPVYERNVEDLLKQHDTLWKERETDEACKARGQIEQQHATLWKEFEFYNRKDKSGGHLLTKDEVRRVIAEEIARLLHERERGT